MINLLKITLELTGLTRISFMAKYLGTTSQTRVHR